MHRITLKYNEPAREESHTHDDGRRDMWRIEGEKADVRRSHIIGDDDKKASAEGDSPKVRVPAAWRAKTARSVR